MLLFDTPQPLDADEIAWVARGVAEALADLHRAGSAHGAVDARHVAVEGEAVRLVPPAAAPSSAAEDVRSLGALINELLAAAPRPSRAAVRGRVSLRSRVRALVLRLRRRRPGLLAVPPAAGTLAEIARLALGPDAEPGAEPQRPRPAPPTAAALAVMLAHRIPSARPPGGQPPPPGPPPSRAAARSPAPPLPRLVRHSLAALPVVALVGSGAWLAASIRARTARPPQAAPAPARTGFDRGVLTTPDGRFALGRADDVVLQGDWLCRGSPLPALLRPATGEVFVFDRWPESAEDVPGRALGVVAGATALEEVPTDDGACPALAAVRNGDLVLIPVDASERAP
jgi:hypothetical protein